MLSLIENFEKPNYFSNYNKLISFKDRNLVHLILPMIFINQWVVESNMEQDAKQISSPLNAEGFLPNLLQTLIDLSHLSTISSEQKAYFLNQCLQAALPIYSMDFKLRIYNMKFFRQKTL